MGEPTCRSSMLARGPAHLRPKSVTLQRNASSTRRFGDLTARGVGTGTAGTRWVPTGGHSAVCQRAHTKATPAAAPSRCMMAGERECK